MNILVRLPFLLASLSLNTLGVKDTPPPLEHVQHTSMDAPIEVQATFQKEDFKPYMLNHFNEGCPANSTCTKEMGKIHKKWIEKLSSTLNKENQAKRLSSFKQKWGIPFDFWLTQTLQHHPKLISWEGNCNYHNREGHKKIKMATSFIKNIKDLNPLKKQGIISTRKLYRLNSLTKKIQHYQVPQTDTPLYLDGDLLIYQRGDNGIYYGLAISPKGMLKIVDTLTPKEYPESIVCPNQLLNEVKNHPDDFEKEIYADTYCQKTFNSKTNSFDIVLLGWSCD